MSDLALAAVDQELTDEELVVEAIASQEAAEEAEVEAGSPHRWKAADSYYGLVQRGWSTRQIGEKCGVSHTYVGACVRAVETWVSTTERPFFQEAYAEITGKAHVSNNAGDSEWFTPPEYIAAAVAVMGGIDLDPASTPEANEVVQAPTFHTAQDNGLEKEWAGRVWMNPPYARPLVDNFCAKLAESFSTGHVSQACVLVNNATETGWFHALAEVSSAMCFPRQRVKFWHPDKESAPLQGQAAIYLGEQIEDFRREFLRFGFTVVL